LVENNILEIKDNQSVTVVDDVSNFAVFLSQRIISSALLKGTVINCSSSTTPI